MGGDVSVSKVFDMGIRLELIPPELVLEKPVLARQRQKYACIVNQSTSGSVRPL